MTPEAMLNFIVTRVRALGVEYLFHRYYGIYPGIVEDNDDPEKRGRVRVRVLALGQKQAPKNIWAMPAVFGGSEGSGLFFPPAVQDRVWVQFIAGDPAKPVHMGGFLGNGKGAAEFNEVFKRGIKTPGGHWIRLSDEDGDEHVTIVSSAGASVTLDKDGGVSLEDAAGSTVVMSATEPSIVVTDSGGSTVSLANGDVELATPDGTSVTLNAAGLTLDTQGAVTVNATSAALNAKTVTVGEGAAQSMVLGDAFAGLFNTHTHPHPMGPTLTPVVPMVPGTHLSLTVKTK